MTSVLVLGGARSGKSRYAEALLAQESAVRYVATGPVPTPTDEEWAARVAEHRRRRPPHWHTVETADVAGVLTDPVGQGPLLVDCLGTWLTRLIDEANAWEDPARAQEVQERAGSALVAALQNTDVEVVFVSNEVGSGVVPATASGRLFRDLLGRLNAQVAAACDRAVLIVAGRVIELPAPPRPRVGAPAQDVPHRPGSPGTVATGFRHLTAWPSPLRPR
ncbi:MAG: bifunctional adenosylcobinamide kinase/adenosylcobinamide-phosphate guanylyltransferase [Austwickia sp.]|nr:bifunctional adenosylcobinamide kinase/adenosylcobinamide-phosphate guanylyltransferase [Austwickia sp.]